MAVRVFSSAHTATNPPGLYPGAPSRSSSVSHSDEMPPKKSSLLTLPAVPKCVSVEPMAPSISGLRWPPLDS